MRDYADTTHLTKTEPNKNIATLFSQADTNVNFAIGVQKSSEWSAVDVDIYGFLELQPRV